MTFRKHIPNNDPDVLLILNDMRNIYQIVHNGKYGFTSTPFMCLIPIVFKLHTQLTTIGKHGQLLRLSCSKSVTKKGDLFYSMVYMKFPEN